MVTSQSRPRKAWLSRTSSYHYTCRYSIATAAFTCDVVGCGHLASGLDVSSIKVITIEQAYVVTTIQA